MCGKWSNHNTAQYIKNQPATPAGFFVHRTNERLAKGISEKTAFGWDSQRQDVLMT